MIENIFLFLQNQILAMKWLNNLIVVILESLNLNINGKIGGSIQFFIYDIIKIFILLSVLIFVISYIQSYFPPAKTKKILGHYKGITANIAGALLGTVTPFCSCSSIPLFIGFTSAGVPIGVTFSFLISSPLVDIGAFILLSSIFGFKTAIIYVIVGIILAVVGGTIIDKIGFEDEIEDFIKKMPAYDGDIKTPSKKERIKYAKKQVIITVKKVFWYVIAGVAIGALIHNWIPGEWIKSILGSNNPFSVLLAVAVGTPMYADIFGTIPVAEALYSKGVEIGTILAFMMAVTALSLPSLILLRKAVKPKLLAFFTFIVTFGIIIIGYTFNIFQTYLT